MNEDCGCCSSGPVLSLGVRNRPGLPEIDYRVGIFATFRQAVLDKLASDARLAGLRTRANDDYAISTIELWSAVADVLSFYQERIANESFLRTAVMRDSVQRLVRLLDYQLFPGSAATTHVAFTLNAGMNATIPARTRIQSIPGADEKPQVFETLSAIAADARLNAPRIFPMPSPSSPTGEGSGGAVVAPDPEALAATAGLAAGDPVLLFAPKQTEILTVRDVSTTDGMRAITWTTPVSRNEFADAWSAKVSGVGAWKAGRTIRAFGHDAPHTVVVPESTTAGDPTTTYLTTAVTSYNPTAAANQIALEARYPDIKAGTHVLIVATVPPASSNTPPTTTTACFEVIGVSDQRATVSANIVQKKNADGTEPPAKSKVISQDSVTHLELNPLSNITLDTVYKDVRDVVIHELIGEQLRFWPYRYGPRLESADVYLPGRRVGWSSVEVGREFRKGVPQPGTILDVKDLPRGRQVLLTDEHGGAPVAGEMRHAAIVGSGVRLSEANPDAGILSRMGLAPDQVTPITALLSSRRNPIKLTAARPEVSITIGEWPTQTLSLLAGTTDLVAVATALQDAIRGAMPGAPSFAGASVWPIGVDRLVVTAGTTSEPVAFGPTASDPLTISDLGLAPGDIQYLDGMLGGPVPSSPSSSINGQIVVSNGMDADSTCPITPPATTQGIATALRTCTMTPLWTGDQRRLVAHVTAENRIIVLPSAPPAEPLSFMRISLDVNAPVSLDARSAVLLGNVAPASHGETIADEVLGDGDASIPFQRFTLKKHPVTHVPGPATQGGGSSLSVFVDGVRWSERRGLYGTSRVDQVYVARTNDDGSTTVQFGDGASGMRPLTGRQNIRATYRQGVGAAGRLRAGQLATLLDRATGVRAATNPLPIDGGVDPESLSMAREVAPGTVRTFGRAVSRRDFEDTALLDGEVARGIADWVWTGNRRAIHLTVAGPDGMTFSPSAIERIAATIKARSDPNATILVSNHARVAVTLSATLIIDQRFIADDVLAAARDALYRSFSFEERRFAQSVYLSDIHRVMQEVPGVVAVDVDTLDLKQGSPEYRARHGIDGNAPQPHPRILILSAHGSRSSPAIVPAELAWLEVPDQDVQLRAMGGLPR